MRSCGAVSFSHENSPLQTHAITLWDRGDSAQRHSTNPLIDVDRQKTAGISDRRALGIGRSQATSFGEKDKVVLEMCTRHDKFFPSSGQEEDSWQGRGSQPQVNLFVASLREGADQKPFAEADPWASYKKEENKEPDVVPR